MGFSLHFIDFVDMTAACLEPVHRFLTCPCNPQSPFNTCSEYAVEKLKPQDNILSQGLGDAWVRKSSYFLMIELLWTIQDVPFTYCVKKESL